MERVDDFNKAPKMKPGKVNFSGTISAVKPRIKLMRSFDQIPTHQYQGYILVLDGRVDEEAREYRIAVGPKAHEKHQFCIGDTITGKGEPVANPKQEWAEFYKVSGLTVNSRGPESEQRPADPDGGIAPPLAAYKENGHFRLSSRTFKAKCLRCPWGATMPTEIFLDHFDHSKKKWRFETHCYGPRDCPHYKSGPPYKVQGRKSWMIYEDDDIERYERGEY